MYHIAGLGDEEHQKYRKPRRAPRRSGPKVSSVGRMERCQMSTIPTYCILTRCMRLTGWL